MKPTRTPDPFFGETLSYTGTIEGHLVGYLGSVISMGVPIEEVRDAVCRVGAVDAVWRLLGNMQGVANEMAAEALLAASDAPPGETRQ